MTQNNNSSKYVPVLKFIGGFIIGAAIGCACAKIYILAKKNKNKR